MAQRKKIKPNIQLSEDAIFALYTVIAGWQVLGQQLVELVSALPRLDGASQEADEAQEDHCANCKHAGQWEQIVDVNGEAGEPRIECKKRKQYVEVFGESGNPNWCPLYERAK